ncbi:MAG TPA: type II toxin-antitoxin system VapC family toxin [Armatimonadota bacterium]|nr:type II toxin-antitoxin system VapC family toxin [Armatimonadota bacterium]
MIDLVVDASVAVKWFLREVYSDEARRLLTFEQRLHVPALLFPEFGNVLWKRVRRAELAAEEAIRIIETLTKLPLTVHPARSLVAAALEIACESGRTVYDSTYLALAIQQQSRLVTADERFFNALRHTALAPYLCWVRDVF